MTVVFILTLLIIGLVAAAGFVERKLPQSKTVVEFLKPHDSWIGLVSMVLGIYWLIKFLLNIGFYLKYAPIVLTIIKVTSFIILLVLGFLLAQTLLRQLIGKNKAASDFADDMVDKLAPLKEKLGLAAIAAGLVNLLLSIT